MEISKGKTPRPRRVLLYGSKGIGKSTWAAQAPRPLFLNIEDGLDDIDCDKTPWLASTEAVMDAIGWLLTAEHSYQTVAIDSADWLEALIFADVAKAHGKEHIEAIGYGKGYEQAAERLTYMLRGLDRLRNDRKMMVIFLAHEQVTKFTPPGSDSYDRYSPAMHKATSSVLQEWVDDILFASYKVFTKQEDLGFNKVRSIAIGGTEREIRCVENAAVVAKNRLGLPETLPMAWDAYAKYLGNINGVVVNGSSKQKVGA